MPIYPYLCQDCGNRFEILTRTFDAPKVSCPRCQGPNTRRRLTTPFLRTGRRRESANETAARDAPIEHYADRGDFESAAREAERAGMSDTEVKTIKQGLDWRDT